MAFDEWVVTEDDMIRDGIESSSGHDIRERTFRFACEVRSLCEITAHQSFTGREMARQLFRAAASIGANLEEADAAHSRADFISKCGIALREARESRYWLRMIQETHATDASTLIDESRQLVAILTTIVHRSSGAHS